MRRSIGNNNIRSVNKPLKKAISPVHRKQTASQQDELRSAAHLKEIENNAKIELSRIDKIATEVENRILGRDDEK